MTEEVIVQAEQVRVVFQLQVLVEVHVTQHLRHDDYNHQGHRVTMKVIMKTIKMEMEMVRM